MRSLTYVPKRSLRRIGSILHVAQGNGTGIYSRYVYRTFGAVPTPSLPRLNNIATHLHGIAPPQSLTGLRRMINVIEIDMSGKMQTKSISFTRLKEESRLHARDILIVDNNSPITQPRILPRRNCIVLTLGPARLIVWHDKVYCFGTSSLPAAKEYAMSLSQHLSQYFTNDTWSMDGQCENPNGNGNQNSTVSTKGSPLGSTFLSRMSFRPNFGLKSDAINNGLPSNGSDKSDSNSMKSDISNKYNSSASDADAELEKETSAIFEFVVLEHALLSQTIRQSKRVSYAQKLVERVLSRVNTVERDDGNLSALFPLGNTVIHYEMVTRGICDAIRALLDDDRDMREACLTDKLLAGHEMDASIRSSKSHQSSHSERDISIEHVHAHHLAPSNATSQSPTHSFQATLHPPTTYTFESPSNGRRADDEDQSLFPNRSQGTIGPYGYPAQPSSLHMSPSSASEHDKVRDVEFYSTPEGKYTRHHSTTHSHGEQVYGRSYWGGHSSNPLSRHEQKILRVSDDTLLALELMLESVYSVASDANMQAVELSRTLRAKQDLLELQQSNYRNHLLSVSLKMSIGSLSLTAATFFTSAFGQNLTSGIEDVPGFLWVTSFASGALAFAVFRALDNYAITSSPTMAHAKRLQALHEFLFKLDTKVDAAKNTVLAATQGHTPTVPATKPSSPILPRSSVTPVPTVPPRSSYFHREDWAALTNGEISQPGLHSTDSQNEADEATAWTKPLPNGTRIGAGSGYPTPGVKSEGRVVKRILQGARETFVNNKPVKVMSDFINRFFGPPTSTLEDDAVRSYHMKMEQSRQKHRSRQHKHWSFRNGNANRGREPSQARTIEDADIPGAALRSTASSHVQSLPIDYRDVEHPDDLKELNEYFSNNKDEQSYTPNSTTSATNIFSRLQHEYRRAPTTDYTSTGSEGKGSTPLGRYNDASIDAYPDGKMEGYDEKSLTNFVREGTPQNLRSMRPLTKEQFRELHEKATGRLLSPEETDLLFDLLDADGDGSVSLNSSEASLIDPQAANHDDNEALGSRQKDN